MDYSVIAKDVAQYAYNLIGTQWKTEIEQQFDDWIGPGSFTVIVGEAVDAASKAQNDTIKAGEEEKKRTLEKAMFIFSVIAPLGLSWMASKLQYTVGPKIFPEWSGRWVGEEIELVKNADPRIASKMIADISKELVGKGFPRLIALNVPETPDLTTNAAKASTSGVSLKTEMELQIKAQKKSVVSSIMAIAENINNNREAYGRGILALYDKDALDRDASESEGQVTMGCQLLINDIVNSVRSTLAGKFPMYGTFPPPTHLSRLSHMIERYLWAIWLVQNDFRVYEQRTQYPNANAMVPNLPVIGPGNGEYLEKSVALHLLEFTGLTTIVLEYEKADHVDMAFTRHGVTSLREWADRESQIPPQARMNGIARKLTPIEHFYAKAAATP